MQVEVKGILNINSFNSKIVYIGEVFDYLVAHGRMKEKEARAKFRQVYIIDLIDFNS